MNNVVLMGRLTRDPEIRWSQSGENQMAIARFTLAVDRRGRKDSSGNREADFISCAAFGKLAEVAEKYYRQGTKLICRGHIQTGSYTNRDGNKVYTTDVIIDEAGFAESKTAGNLNSENRKPAAAASKESEGFMSVPDSAEDMGLPFN